MSNTPTRTACFRPDEYRDLELFANRRERLDDLTETLASFVDPQAPGQVRVLVRGRRGVGKSMLTRKAIEKIRNEYGPLTVEVDGARTLDAERFLRELARDLAKEVLENVSDEDLRKNAEFLLRLAAATKVSVKQAQEWAKSLKMGLKVTHRFFDRIGFEFGLQNTSGARRLVEESYQRDVDGELLRELIQALILDCHREGQAVVLFLDNLDQVGYPEREEDVRRVTDLARYLLNLERCVVVANLRSEFVSADLLKLSSLPIEVEGLSAEELMEIFERRVEYRGGGVREKLEKSGLATIAQRLTEKTDNAWAFLKWLLFLDYRPIDFDPADMGQLEEALGTFAIQEFTGLRLDEMKKIAAEFAEDPCGLRKRSDLERAGFSDEDVERAARYGVLVPDWLLSPDRYQLAPSLSFLIPPRQ